MAIGHINTTQITNIPISIFFTLFKNGGSGVICCWVRIVITARGQMILCLSPMGDANGGSIGKKLGGASALGHASIGHNPRWSAWGKTAGCWSKTAKCTKLAPFEYRGGNTLHVPSVTTSVAAVAIASKPLTPCIALVKAERVNLSNYLMHVFMQQILLRSKMHKLLHHALA